MGSHQCSGNTAALMPMPSTMKAKAVSLVRESSIGARRLAMYSRFSVPVSAYNRATPIRKNVAPTVPITR